MPLIVLGVGANMLFGQDYAVQNVWITNDLTLLVTSYLLDPERR